MRAPLAALALALLLAPVVLPTAGCDDTDCPQCPPVDPPTPDPTIANVWPHADGDTWIHDLQVRGYEGDPAEVLDPEEPVPPLPDLETLYARLQAPVTRPPLGASAGLYRLSFDGEVTTDAGVTAQHLREELFDASWVKRPLAPHPDRLRARILAARPDLRARRPAAGKELGDELQAPLLMGGYAFAAAADGLYGYGDLNDDYSWVYLESDLTVGHEFSMQLVPDLADDVWLHGRIWSVGDLTIGGRTHEKCVECFYAIDLGVVEATDEGGQVIGRWRPLILGVVHYAPTLGPVACEQMDIVLADVLQDADPGILVTSAALSGLQIGP